VEVLAQVLVRGDSVVVRERIQTTQEVALEVVIQEAQHLIMVLISKAVAVDPTIQVQTKSIYKV
jgi:hypothetical protein